MAKRNSRPWVKKLTEPIKGELQLLPAPAAPVDWLDSDARQLLRTGAMRLLKAVAGEDPDTFDPRRSRDAIQALSLLFDRVPDVLCFEANSTGAGALDADGAIDLYSPEGQVYIARAIEVLERAKDEKSTGSLCS